MSERLIIDITSQGERVANAYYRWGALPSELIRLTQTILGNLANIEDDLFGSIYHALYETGVRPGPKEVEYLQTIGIDVHVEVKDGEMAFSEEGIRQLGQAEEYHVSISSEDRTADLSMLLHWKLDEDSEAWRYMDMQREGMPTTEWEMDLTKLDGRDLQEIFRVGAEASELDTLFIIKGQRHMIDPFLWWSVQRHS